MQPDKVVTDTKGSRQGSREASIPILVSELGPQSYPVWRELEPVPAGARPHPHPKHR